MTNEIVEALLELGLTAVDWVDASQFAHLTGIAEEKLTHRRKKWAEDLVWTKQDGNIYYSIRGYNQWLTAQAQSRYLKACGSEVNQSRLLSEAEGETTASLSPTLRLRKISKQPAKLELN